MSSIIRDKYWQINTQIGYYLLILFSASCVFLSACSNQIDHRLILGHWKAERMQLQGLYLPMGPEFLVTETNISSLNGEINIPISNFTEKKSSVIIDGPFGVGFYFHFVNNDRIFFDLPIVGNIYFDRVFENSSIQNAPSDAIGRAGEDSAARLVTNSALSISSPVVAASMAPTVAVSPLTVQSVKQVTLKSMSVSDAMPRDIVSFVHLAKDQLHHGKLFEAEATLDAAQKQFSNLPMIDYQFAELRIRQNNADDAIHYLLLAFQNGFNQVSMVRENEYFVPLKSDSRFVALMARYQ